jgi:hypothetical protein
MFQDEFYQSLAQNIKVVKIVFPSGNHSLVHVVCPEAIKEEVLGAMKHAYSSGPPMLNFSEMIAVVAEMTVMRRAFEKAVELFRARERLISAAHGVSAVIKGSGEKMFSKELKFLKLSRNTDEARQAVETGIKKLRWASRPLFMLVGAVDRVIMPGDKIEF